MKIQTVIQPNIGENAIAAIATMLSYYGCIMPISELRPHNITSRGGSTPDQVRNMAARYGLDTEIIEADMDGLRKMKLPVVARWNKHFYCIVSKIGKVAIVGESGCGKSTLLKIILGVLKPDDGSVFVDRIPLDTVNLRSYRRHIGSVFQFSKVMPGTVYSNIAFCNKPVSREEAVEAAKRADLDETIMKLPLGYDTEISDSNTGGFSGGQRQRLLIARAFASKPGLMILDEATSALDNLSQDRVLDAVYEETCTVLMVAHRLSTVRNCDRIIVLKDGKIDEEGTFNELMEKEGTFYELMRRQSA